MKLFSNRGSRRTVKKPVYKKIIAVCLLIITLSAAGFFGLVYLRGTAEPPDDIPEPVGNTPEPVATHDVHEVPPVETPPPEDNIREIIVETVDISVPKGEKVAPGDFVADADIIDEFTIASITFVTEPDTYAIGEKMVEILVEDEFGNNGVFEAMLIVLPNDIPPVIEGIRTIESMRGNAIIYRQGISAHDAFGRQLDFEVDSSEVDQNKLGRYTIVYRTEDIYGLVTEEEAIVLIVDIDTEWVNGRIDEIFAEIFTDDMTQVEQAQAIFTWIKGYLSFVARAAAPQSAYEGAYRGLQDRRGGCTIYSSLSYVMLTRAEIPTLRIERVPEAPSRHRWNLINPDGLGWHHFDAFPILLGGVRNELYMFTAQHAENFTRRMQAVGSVRMYYVYDPELYPEIVYECIDCTTLC